MGKNTRSVNNCVRPTLSNILIKALCNVDIEGRIVAYADDILIIFTGYNFEEARTSLITEINKN